MPVYLGDKKVSIFAGAGAAKLQEKTVTPTERQQTVTPDTGYDGMSQGHGRTPCPRATLAAVSPRKPPADLHSGNHRSDRLQLRAVFERSADD